ncbi:hypothetical protein RUM43_012842 [Polyplax serrata]|uniref:Uncharacterized protein n=1 Tax=Polyplax serrata TaxID=468196 RepID=A0AAN8PIP5_POLSC
MADLKCTSSATARIIGPIQTSSEEAEVDLTTKKKNREQKGKAEVPYKKEEKANEMVTGNKRLEKSNKDVVVRGGKLKGDVTKKWKRTKETVKDVKIKIKKCRKDREGRRVRTEDK